MTTRQLTAGSSSASIHESLNAHKQQHFLQPDEILLPPPPVPTAPAPSPVVPLSLPLPVSLQPEPQQDAARDHRRPSSTKSIEKMSHHALHVRILRLAWCGAILVGERLVYNVMLRRCYWPADPAWPKDEASVKEQYRIAIVADPQLTDWFSYKQKGLVLALVEFYTDLFMSRSFDHFHSLHRPDAVLFLGDLMDGARDTVDQETYEKNLQRFHRIFQTRRTAFNMRPIVEYTAKPFLPIAAGSASDAAADNKSQRGTASANIRRGDGDGTVAAGGWYEDLARALAQDRQGTFYRLTGPVPGSPEELEQVRETRRSLRLYMAGNHDIGFGDTAIPRAMRMYRQSFGPLNYVVDLGQHRLVMLDTLTLGGHATNVQVQRQEAQRMLDQIAQQDPQTSLPRILFSHVPLHRPPHTDCGVERKTTKSIEQGRGVQFQNLVEPELSQEILDKVRPRMVFSGDDHDWCRVIHPASGPGATPVPEVTVPTFSFAQGVDQPGLVMLNLYNPSGSIDNASNLTMAGKTSNQATFTYRSCMLPIQLHVYFSYAAFLVFTLVWTLVQRYRWLQHRSASTGYLNIAPVDNDRAQQPLLMSKDRDGSDALDDKATVYVGIPQSPDTPLLTTPTLTTSSSSCLTSRLYWRCIWLDVWHIASLPVILYMMLLIL